MQAVKVLIDYKTPCVSQKHLDPWAIDLKWCPYQMQDEREHQERADKLCGVGMLESGNNTKCGSCREPTGSSHGWVGGGDLSGGKSWQVFCKIRGLPEIKLMIQ